MTDLAGKKCVPCEGGASPMEQHEAQDMLKQINDAWKLEKGHLKRTFKFDDFRKALNFTNRVGEIAEQEGHHPDIYLTYGKVALEVWTHTVDGLTENDFIFAAKVDQLQ